MKTGQESSSPANFWATGFGRIGNDADAPFFKTKLIEGTTPSSGVILDLDHNIVNGDEKIIMAYLLIENLAGTFNYVEPDISTAELIIKF